jgi:LPS export ABC transporter protein LptC
VGCTDTDAPDGAPVETSGVEREIRDFNLTETREGHRSWELHSETAWRLPSESRIRMEDVDLVFFDDAGAERSRMTARRGEVDEDSGAMTARGHVKVITADMDTLLTEELNYDKTSDRITGPGFVRLSSPDRVLTGVGFEADPDLTDYKVYEDVQITIVDQERVIDDGP